MLTLIMFLPLVGVLLCALLPKRFEGAAKYIALFTTAANASLAAFLVGGFTRGGGMQFETVIDWIPQIGMQYHVGVDGISMPILVLSCVLAFLAVIASWKIDEKPKFYFAMLLLLATGMNGVFTALDFVLFYVFWEIVLVPMYFIINQWGGERRQYAAVKFFLYTFFGSVFMLVGIIALYLQTGTFNMVELANGAAALPAFVPFGFQWWVFAAFLLGFAIKVPMWPFHTWLPDAHVEAPTAASVLLAGIMLKMGTYGLIRIALPILPEAFLWFQPLIAVLAVISIIYGAIVAFAQTDVKKLVAYSSVSHMGFAMLGIAAGTATGINAAMAVNISHGLTTGMLFFLVGMIYERTHTRKIKDLRGVAAQMPIYAGLFVFASFASMGLPMLSGFMGEFLALVAAWQGFAAINMQYLTVFAAIGILLGGAYMLWLLQRVIFGEPSEVVEGQKDLNFREIFVLVPLAVFVVAFGVRWSLLLDYVDPAAKAIARAIGLGA
ncbi:MAG: NADH-quinone oxidoreductase subunit M [Coriobacteriia bacterium]|nr:NADH-quinone oxidoreductase subunit M [Coriobacteriia bacterium]